jgi:hypothetical protein
MAALRSRPAVNHLDRLEDRVARLEQRSLPPARRESFAQAIGTLRQWAKDADAVTVTQGNAVQVLQVVVDRLGVFFDRFADLLEHELSRR